MSTHLGPSLFMAHPITIYMNKIFMASHWITTQLFIAHPLSEHKYYYSGVCLLSCENKWLTSYLATAYDCDYNTRIIWLPYNPNSELGGRMGRPSTIVLSTVEEMLMYYYINITSTPLNTWGFLANLNKSFLKYIEKKLK